MNRVTEFIVKVVGVASITGAAFVLVGAILALGVSWLWQGLAVAVWALGAVPAVYIMWRIDLSGEAQP